MKTDLDVLRSRKETCASQLVDDNRETFSISTFNILSDVHMLNAANFDFYHYYYKDWSAEDYKSASEEERFGRKEKVVEELKILNSDILCLQEVCVSFFSQLSKSLGKHGYESYFHRKTFGTGEGVAVCIKTSKFNVLQTHYLPWSDLLEAKRIAYGYEREAVAFCDIDSVALALELQSVESGQMLLLCNFHALYEPECPDVSVLQISWITERLAGIQQEMTKRNHLNQECPIAFVGDFNNDPTLYGYKLAVNGKLTPAEVLQLQRTMYNIEDYGFKPVERKSKHVASGLFPNEFVLPIKFYSAYKEAKGSELPTCVDRALLVCLDYIFYTKSLQLLSVLDLPDIPQLKASGDVSLLPSDHLPLQAKFAFGIADVVKQQETTSKI